MLCLDELAEEEMDMGSERGEGGRYSSNSVATGVGASSAICGAVACWSDMTVRSLESARDLTS